GQATEKADDDDDDEAGTGVALHEFHRPVHGAVELALALQQATPALCLRLVDGAAAQVVVDVHLLAGQGIEREARADLRDTLGTLGDDDELGDGDDEEDDEAHGDIAADDEG